MADVGRWQSLAFAPTVLGGWFDYRKPVQNPSQAGTERPAMQAGNGFERRECRKARDDDKEAVSDVQYSSGLDEPELLLRTPARARRFARRAVPSGAVATRRPAIEITEGVPQLS